MKLIPALSIKEGRVAIVEDGNYVFLRNVEGQFRNPVNLIREWKFSGEEVFVLDIDGLERNSPDLDTVKRIAAYKDVWLDAGVDDADSMMDLFVSDASRVVMGTICLESLVELEKALDISENIIISVGYDGGVVSPDPSIAGLTLEEIMEKLGKIENLRNGMLFDLGGIRDGKRMDLETISKIAGQFKEFYVAGHINREDIPALEDAGISGAIIDFRKMEDMLDEGT